MTKGWHTNSGTLRPMYVDSVLCMGEGAEQHRGRGIGGCEAVPKGIRESCQRWNGVEKQMWISPTRGGTEWKSRCGSQAAKPVPQMVDRGCTIARWGGAGVRTTLGSPVWGCG